MSRRFDKPAALRLPPLRAGLAALALLLPPVVAPALAETGDWAEGEHVGLRLIATHVAPGGPLEGVVEITLDPGWKTYWRNPGDAGIPPRLDFSASANASDAVIAFPAPEREDDGVSVSNVYHDRVLLPVRFAASDAGKPVSLQLSADLGVCKDICLPVSLTARLDLPAGEADADDAAAIAAAKAALPQPGKAGVFEVASLKRVGGSDSEPEFEAGVTTMKAGDGLVFVETPADWYPATPMPAAGGDGATRFRFSIDRKTATTPLAGATIRLTLTENGAATSRGFKLSADGAAVPLAD